MRIRLTKFAIFLIVALNIFLLFVSWRMFFDVGDNSQRIDEIRKFFNRQQAMSLERKQTDKSKDRIEEANKFLAKSLTIVFRDFYDFDNDLKSGIEHLIALIPDINILIISEGFPYPPMNIFVSSSHPNQSSKGSTLIFKENVKFLNLNYDIHKPAYDNNPLNYIQTKYSLLMPDSFRLSNGRQFFQRLIKSLTRNEQQHESRRQILVVPFTSNNKLINYCFRVNVDVRNWTLEYEVKNSTKNCNLFTQKNALLLESTLLNEFHEPFASPFPEYFFLQATFGNLKLKFSNETFADGRKLMTSYHSRVKRKVMKKTQFKEMYKKLEFKRIIKHYQFVQQSKIHQKNSKKSKKGAVVSKSKDTIDVILEPLDMPTSLTTNQSLSSLIQMKTDTNYFGCEKNTKSCIGQIFNDEPFYRYVNRHTPPCCREKLKAVFVYLIEELENTGVRYWLDNEALRNSIEINDLSSDAFEIDISFNVNDYNRSTALKRCFDSRPYTDPSAGFYWIKATDGQYLKVQYTKINEIHVNLLPFELKNNRMIPKGFYGLKAREFSVEFLHPTSNVFFLGRNVFAPNNPKTYLQAKGYKFD